MNLLVVEDNLESAQLLVRLFTGLGYYVLHKTHGFDGLKAAREQRFDAVLLDFDLPDIDGSQIGLLIRSQIKDIAIVAVTASYDKITRSKARVFGFDAIIGKPWSVKELLETVDLAIKHHSTADQVNPAIAAGPAQSAASPALNA